MMNSICFQMKSTTSCCCCMYTLYVYHTVHNDTTDVHYSYSVGLKVYIHVHLVEKQYIHHYPKFTHSCQTKKLTCIYVTPFLLSVCYFQAQLYFFSVGHHLSPCVSFLLSFSFLISLTNYEDLPLNPYYSSTALPHYHQLCFHTSLLSAL